MVEYSIGEEINCFEMAMSNSNDTSLMLTERGYVWIIITDIGMCSLLRNWRELLLCQNLDRCAITLSKYFYERIVSTHLMPL